jgi:hypothetical protein
VALARQIAQQAAKDHQPRRLGPPIVQPGELTRQKLHKIVEANLTPSDVSRSENATREACGLHGDEGCELSVTARPCGVDPPDAPEFRDQIGLPTT